EKVVVKIDFHRASIGARATKRRCVGEMLKLVEPAQVGCEHAADRSRGGSAVGVVANGAKHRAHIQARAAADAMQDVALFDISEQFAPAIVEQDDVKFFWAVHFVWLPRPANQRVIAGDWL